MNGPETGGAWAHVDDAHCADMVLGLMPEDDRRGALRHMAACPACEDRLRAHVGAAERAAFDAPGNRRAGTAVLPLAWYRRPGPLVGLAAAAALVVVGALPLFHPVSHAPDATFGLPAPGPAVRTREGLAEDPHLTAGLAAYASRDLATADRELTIARTAGPSEQLRLVYLADVRLARGDASGALALLRALRWTEVPEPWRRDAADMLVRTLRRTGHSAEADSIEHALRTLDPATPFIP